ncbi:MAG: hypothetical protein ACO3NB_03985, partial [Ilumatobacteraceae bacterium]
MKVNRSRATEPLNLRDSDDLGDPDALSDHQIVVRRRERRWLGVVAAGLAVVALLAVIVYGTVSWRELQRINPP